MSRPRCQPVRLLAAFFFFFKEDIGRGCLTVIIHSDSPEEPKLDRMGALWIHFRKLKQYACTTRKHKSGLEEVPSLTQGSAQQEHWADSQGGEPQQHRHFIMPVSFSSFLSESHCVTHSPVSVSQCWAFYYNFIFISVYVQICVSRVCADSQGGQAKMLAPLTLELQVVVSGLIWVLGMELGSSEEL